LKGFSTLLAAALTLLLFSACSGNRVATNPDNEQWFCQSNELGDGWECIQDANLAQVPVPTRMPPAPAPPETQTAATDFEDPLNLDDLNAPLERNPGPLPDTARSVADDAPSVAPAGSAVAPNAADTAIPQSPQAGDTVASAEGPATTVATPLWDQVETDLSDPATSASSDPAFTPPTLDLSAPTEDPSDSEASPEPVAATGSQIPRHIALAYVPPEPTPILELPSDYFAVQLLAMQSREGVEGYISEHGLRGMSGARVENEGDIFYVLIVGIYTTYDSALEASTDLPPPLDTVEAWIRPLGSLQEAMKRADELVGTPRF
jgi:hypothetical protein